jgi:hypothetical protein
MRRFSLAVHWASFIGEAHVAEISSECPVAQLVAGDQRISDFGENCIRLYAANDKNLEGESLQLRACTETAFCPQNNLGVQNPQCSPWTYAIGKAKFGDTVCFPTVRTLCRCVGSHQATLVPLWGRFITPHSVPFFFLHRAAAAFLATSERCSSVIVVSLLFPPIFPPSKTFVCDRVADLLLRGDHEGSGANARVAGDDEEMQRFVRIEDLFKGRHFDGQIIILCVAWYTSFKLSLRDLVIMMADRGISVTHTTILRWIQRYLPEFEKRWWRYARPVGGSWRMDEAYSALSSARFRRV